MAVEYIQLNSSATDRAWEDVNPNQRTEGVEAYIFVQNLLSAFPLDAQGLLPKDYRTSVCENALANQPCNLGPLCTGAHSVAEMRVEAGIELKHLPENYKLSFCREVATGGRTVFPEYGFAMQVPGLALSACLKAHLWLSWVLLAETIRKTGHRYKTRLYVRLLVEI